MSLSASFAQVGGLAAAGALVAAFGPGIVFAIDGASFAASAVSLGLLRLPPRKMPERASFRKDLAGGWHELVIRPWYWINLIAHACCNFAIPAYLVLGPVIASEKLGGPSAWGALSASFAGGTVIGGFIGLRLRLSRPLVVANLAGALGALPLLALAPPLATWVIAVASVLCGSGLTVLNTVWYATIQQLVPDQVLSRVSSYDWLISLIAMPAGYAIAGPAAAAIGNSATLNWSAALIAVPVMITVLVPGVRRVRRTGGGKVVGPPCAGQALRSGRSGLTSGPDGVANIAVSVPVDDPAGPPPHHCHRVDGADTRSTCPVPRDSCCGMLGRRAAAARAGALADPLARSCRTARGSAAMPGRHSTGTGSTSLTRRRRCWSPPRACWSTSSETRSMS